MGAPPPRSVLAPQPSRTACRCRHGSARGRGRPRHNSAPRTAPSVGRRVGERGPNPVSAANRSAHARRQAATATRRASTACTHRRASSSILAASGSPTRRLVQQHHMLRRACVAATAPNAAFGRLRPARPKPFMPLASAGAGNETARATRRQRYGGILPGRWTVGKVDGESA
jgi:hypothetical protein